MRWSSRASCSWPGGPRTTSRPTARRASASNGHEAGSLRTLRDALPAQAAWALDGIEEPGDLWRAEVAWWRRVEQDAEGLVHAPLMGEPMVIGSVVGLGVDAWRTAAALESAARGGAGDSYDAFEAVA